MTYARIGMYTVKPGTLDAILKKAEAELVPQTQQQPGFRRYFTIRTGEDSLVSVTVWEDKAQAEQAAERLSGWVRAEMGSSLVKAENHVGEITIASTPRGGAAKYARIGVWHFNPGTDLVTLTERVKLRRCRASSRPEPSKSGSGTWSRSMPTRRRSRRPRRRATPRHGFRKT